MRSSEWSCAFGVRLVCCRRCLVVPSWLLLCAVIAGTWALLVAGLVLGRLAGWRLGINRAGVILTVGGTVLAVAVCDCLLIGLWLWARVRSSSCLAAGV